LFTSKLVRDRIPEIIRSRGESPLVHVATDVEYDSALLVKLEEEVKEFTESGSVEELADILEVVDAICSHRHIDRLVLLRAQMEKAKSRGRFSKRLILE
jgi:predicted house-cleaning noncanonical NTP pyrophosphatase (MazG superfamily)